MKSPYVRKAILFFRYIILRYPQDDYLQYFSQSMENIILNLILVLRYAFITCSFGYGIAGSDQVR